MICVKEVNKKLRFAFGDVSGISERYIATFFGNVAFGYGKGDTKTEAIFNLIFKRA